MPGTPRFRSRSACWLALLFAPALLCGSDASVLVVWTSGVTPFEEAMSGLRAGGIDLSNVVDLKSATAAGDLEAAARRSPRLTIAMGVASLTEVKKRRIPGIILATMVLRADAAESELSAGQKLTAIYLDVSVAEVAARLKALFPGKNRLGVIRNPTRDAPLDARGLSVEVRDCAGPETLLKTFLAFKRKADFVFVQPDASLYNDATARPLLMASLENGIPVIGFSASFVKAGAALGIYPDFKDVGAQTADLARRSLNSTLLPPAELPRKLIVASNQGVLRILGSEYKTKPEFPVTVLK